MLSSKFEMIKLLLAHEHVICLFSVRCMHLLKMSVVNSKVITIHLLVQRNIS